MPNRKDNKGRILRRGESQRPDGRYLFKYANWMGKTCFVYSWTLTTHDQTPQGKKKDFCLRQKEQQIQKDFFDHIAPANMSVMTLVESYLTTKTAVRSTTTAGYRTVMNYLRSDSFSVTPISSLTTMDAKKWLIHLQRDIGKGYSSICSLRGVLRPAFKLAEESGLIRRNPFDFELGDVLVNDMVSREPLSVRQERLLLDFLHNDTHYSRYYEVFYILLNTGLRVSEFCGLTVDDIDFEHHCIRVVRQLQRAADMHYYIERPKTKSGTRYLPMTRKTESAFLALVNVRKQKGQGFAVDGIGGFLCSDKNGMPCVALHWEHRLKYAVMKHNRIYKEELPHITPHQLRHTYCTRMAREGMSPAKLKYLMGHSDIGTTYNTYTHLGLEDVREEVLAIEGNRS